MSVRVRVEVRHAAWLALRLVGVKVHDLGSGLVAVAVLVLVSVRVSIGLSVSVRVSASLRGKVRFTLVQ